MSGQNWAKLANEWIGLSNCFASAPQRTYAICRLRFIAPQAAHEQVSRRLSPSILNRVNTPHTVHVIGPPPRLIIHASNRDIGGGLQGNRMKSAGAVLTRSCESRERPVGLSARRPARTNLCSRDGTGMR